MLETSLCETQQERNQLHTAFEGLQKQSDDAQNVHSQTVSELQREKNALAENVQKLAAIERRLENPVPLWVDVSPFVADHDCRTILKEEVRIVIPRGDDYLT